MTGNISGLMAVCSYFQEFGQAGLILPDGWFGRPYDNLFTLTGVQASYSLLKIELDGDLDLSFQGQVEVSRDQQEIAISGYDGLSFTWREDDSADYHSENFMNGAVRFRVASARIS